MTCGNEYCMENCKLCKMKIISPEFDVDCVDLNFQKFIVIFQEYNSV